MNKGRSVQCPVFGTFIPAASYIQIQSLRAGEEDTTLSQLSGPLTLDNLSRLENTNVCFAPNVQLLETAKLMYKDDGVQNLNPYQTIVSLSTSN